MTRVIALATLAGLLVAATPSTGEAGRTGRRVDAPKAGDRTAMTITATKRSNGTYKLRFLRTDAKVAERTATPAKPAQASKPASRAKARD